MRKASFILFLLPTVLLADDVYLKGAGMISGQITEQTDTMVTINIGDGIVGVPMDRVDHIVKNRSPLDDYADRAAKLAPQDVNGWRALGAWAAQKGLSSQSREAYQKVVALVPNDPEANEALGLVLLNGRWVTEEESYRERGYVYYDGEWMMPAEAQLLQQQAAADQAARQARAAQSDALAAQARTEEAEARAAQEQADAETYPQINNNDAVYWGGYGYGVNYWPTAGVIGQPINRPIQQPVNRPAQLPSGGRR